MDNIKIYQVDDWAYIAAASEAEAEAYVEKSWQRCDDPEDNEIVERPKEGVLLELLNAHIAQGGTFPDLIGIDSHYA